MTSIIGHPECIQVERDKIFCARIDQRLMRVWNSKLPTAGKIFLNFYADSNIPVLGMWKHQQLLHFLHSLPKIPPFSKTIDNLWGSLPRSWGDRGTLSLSFQLLMNICTQADQVYHYKWERDLQTILTKDQTGRITFFAYKASLCSKYQEITYKIMTWWYRTPSVLVNLFPQQHDLCRLWDCPVLRPFWHQGT